jgi:riboflavin synthase
MFTGIVEAMGTVRAREAAADAVRLVVEAGATRVESDVGASVAVNGVCLTVVARGPDTLGFDVGSATLGATTLGELVPGDRVNLERPLGFGGALDGHLVLGHADGVGTITDVERLPTTARLRIALPSVDLEPLVVLKGSVAVDGVSLTVADVGDMAFEVMIIPHTWAATTLGRAVVGRRVNLEMDVIGKYVLRVLSLRAVS